MVSDPAPPLTCTKPSSEERSPATFVPSPRLTTMFWNRPTVSDSTLPIVSSPAPPSYCTAPVTLMLPTSVDEPASPVAIVTLRPKTPSSVTPIPRVARMRVVLAPSPRFRSMFPSVTIAPSRSFPSRAVIVMVWPPSPSNSSPVRRSARRVELFPPRKSTSISPPSDSSPSSPKICWVA